MPAGAFFSKNWVPEGFKSRFDLLERWGSTRAFDWCAVRHQSVDLRRVTAILLQQKNFGPNVIYVAGILILYYIKNRCIIILYIMHYKRR